LRSDAATGPSPVLTKAAPDAFEEDCRRASVVVATRDAPPANCAATVIGRSLWRDRGALALRRDGSGFVIESTRAVNFDRPWAPRQSRTSGTATPRRCDKSVRDFTCGAARCDAASGGSRAG
jgi:competence protein ComEC